MRTIKFRAWDKKEKVMFTPNLTGTTVNVFNGKTVKTPIRNKCIEDMQRFFGAIMTIKGVELMQYIGLKDKKGKEIYEGDILKVDWYGNKSKHYEVVEYGVINGFACWGMGFELPEMGRDSKEIEIIGNIYEDKKLLGIRSDT